ncbi:MAG: DNA repair protein RadC [Pseudomonadota bacterium]
MPIVDDKAGHRQRMRERMLQRGEAAFLDHELLEYVLSLAVTRRDMKPLAKELIRAFGSFAGVIAATPDDLRMVDGVGDTVVATLKLVEGSALRLLKEGIENRPLLGSWQAVQDYLHAAMAHKSREEFRVLALDPKNVLMRDVVVSTGTVNQTAVHIREIVQLVLNLGATSIVLVHNHPSGDAKPSRDDIALTARIGDVCRVLGIGLHDHVIIAKGGSASFKSLGLL